MVQRFPPLKPLVHQDTCTVLLFDRGFGPHQSLDLVEIYAFAAWTKLGFRSLSPRLARVRPDCAADPVARARVGRGGGGRRDVMTGGLDHTNR